MKSLLTKFKVGSTVNSGNNNLTANLSVVVGDAPENKSFSMYTPSGEARLHITNPSALDFFEPGKEVYVLFIKKENEIETINFDQCAESNVGEKHNLDWLYTEALELIDNAYSFLSAKGISNVDGRRESLLTNIRNFRNYKQKP